MLETYSSCNRRIAIRGGAAGHESESEGERVVPEDSLIEQSSDEASSLMDSPLSPEAKRKTS